LSGLSQLRIERGRPQRDVGAIRETSFAIAERLDALKIPFVFVTGYDAAVSIPAPFSDRPRLPKPCSTEALEEELRRGSAPAE
jgi:hypothetical protein